MHSLGELDWYKWVKGNIRRFLSLYGTVSASLSCWQGTQGDQEDSGDGCILPRGKNWGGGRGQEAGWEVCQAIVEDLSHQGEAWTVTWVVATKESLDVLETENGIIQTLNLVALWRGTEWGDWCQGPQGRHSEKLSVGLGGWEKNHEKGTK